MLNSTEDREHPNRSAPWIWGDTNWNSALNQFTKASGLTITIYDLNGDRQIGPLIAHPLIQFIADTGAWETGKCEKKECEIAKKVVDTGEPTSTHFEEALYIQGLPLKFRGEICGVLIVGWAFDQFADPIRCARLARTFGLPENILWKVAREAPPISRDRFRTYVSLLETLAASILRQHALVDEARDASRMKDQFMATASHELKTPLTSICLQLELLRRLKSPTEEQLLRGMNIIDRSLKTQNKLVDDLLDTSRVATGKLRLDIESLDLGDLIRTAVDTATPGAEAKGIQVTFQQFPTRLKYKGDVTRLQQVYWNLLNNAVKFTSSAGFVSIDAREIAGHYVVAVRDSGRGIDTKSLPKLFDAFFQIQSKHDGSNNGLGLGLSVAKAVIDLHGGTLVAFSDGPGRGACFTAAIPCMTHDRSLVAHE